MIPDNYDYGTLTSGAKSGTFTLTNSSGAASGALTVTLALPSSGAGFTKTADTCTGVSLKAGGTCSVTVGYAFTSAGQTDTATLTASNKKTSASLTLTGRSASPPKLGWSAPNGTRITSYDYGTLTSGTKPETFTMTNSGGSAREH